MLHLFISSFFLLTSKKSQIDGKEGTQDVSAAQTPCIRYMEKVICSYLRSKVLIYETGFRDAALVSGGAISGALLRHFVSEAAAHRGLKVG